MAKVPNVETHLTAFVSRSVKDMLESVSGRCQNRPSKPTYFKDREGEGEC